MFKIVKMDNRDCTPKKSKKLSHYTHNLKMILKIIRVDIPTSVKEPKKNLQVIDQNFCKFTESIDRKKIVQIK